MDKVEKLRDELRDMGIHTVAKQGPDSRWEVEISTTRESALKFFNTRGVFKSGKFRMDPIIHKEMGSRKGAGDDEKDTFVGGSRNDLVKDLNGGINLTPFITQKNKFLKSDLISKLKTKGALGKPKRKRRMSEHDGEWNFDKRWDLKAFETTRRERRLNRTIKMEVNFSINCGTSASQINKFGAMVWALADIIENSGIQVEIEWVNTTNEPDAANRVRFGTTRILLKKPGEYIAPQNLAALFTSNFYRRVGFGFLALMAGVSNDYTSCGGLGHPKTPPRAIEFNDGVLRISPALPKVCAAEVEREILKAIV